MSVEPEAVPKRKRRPGVYAVIPASLDEDPRMIELGADLSPTKADAARYGYVRMLLAAKRQNAGTFASELHLRSLLGRHASFIEAYRRVELLDGLTVADWDEWQIDQPEDPTHADRQRRYRERKAAEARDREAAERGPAPSDASRVTGRDSRVEVEGDVEGEVDRDVERDGLPSDVHTSSFSPTRGTTSPGPPVSGSSDVELRSPAPPPGRGERWNRADYGLTPAAEVTS